MNAFERVLDLLCDTGTTPRRSGAGYSARCPAHYDKSPSLSVRESETGVLLYCFAGCRTADVVAALGLQMRDLFDRPASRPVERKERRSALVSDPGWTHVAEPPDVPDVNRRAVYAASTAYVEVGHHQGGPVEPW